MSEGRYPISRTWLRGNRALAGLFLVGALAAVAGARTGSHPLPLPLTALCVVVCGGFASVGLCLARNPDRYTIEVLDQGLRSGASPSVLPWGMIAALRDHPMLTRIDVLGPAGPTGIRLEYQLEGFDELLRQVAARIPPLSGSQARTFSRRILTGRQATALLLVLLVVATPGAWAWRSHGDPSGLFVALGILVLMAVLELSQVLSVSLQDASVVVRRGFRRLEIPLARITSIDLELVSGSRGSLRLDVFLTESSGERTRVRPEGVDPFVLRQALEEARKAV